MLAIILPFDGDDHPHDSVVALLLEQLPGYGACCGWPARIMPAPAVCLNMTLGAHCPRAGEQFRTPTQIPSRQMTPATIATAAIRHRPTAVSAERVCSKSNPAHRP